MQGYAALSLVRQRPELAVMQQPGYLFPMFALFCRQIDAMNAGTGRPALRSQVAIALTTIFTGARCDMRLRHASRCGVLAVNGALWRSPNSAAM